MNRLYKVSDSQKKKEKKSGKSDLLALLLNTD